MTYFFRFHQRTARPISGDGRQALTVIGPTLASMQFHPLARPIRQSYWSIVKAIAASIIGLATVAVSHSFQPAASRPGRHQHTSEPIAALMAIKAEKAATAFQLRTSTDTMPMIIAPTTWPQTKGWMRRTALYRHDTATGRRRRVGLGAD